MEWSPIREYSRNIRYMHFSWNGDNARTYKRPHGIRRHTSHYWYRRDQNLLFFFFNNHVGKPSITKSSYPCCTNTIFKVWRGIRTALELTRTQRKFRNDKTQPSYIRSVPQPIVREFLFCIFSFFLTFSVLHLVLLSPLPSFHVCLTSF